MKVPENLECYFQKSELLPAIVQESGTNQVLMLAYMNQESLRKTLWNKGATSGHLQKVVDLWADCDDDTLLITVEQTGPACHTGAHSCFFKRLWEEEK